MSSPCEVLIRILALLQRKTLIKHKNRTFKFLKRHYLIVRSMKNVAVLTEDGAFALFFRPHPGEFDSSRVPTPGNLPSKAKKMLMSKGVSPMGGGGRWLGAGLIDRCITWGERFFLIRTKLVREKGTRLDRAIVIVRHVSFPKQ